MRLFGGGSSNRSGGGASSGDCPYWQGKHIFAISARSFLRTEEFRGKETQYRVQPMKCHCGKKTEEIHKVSRGGH